MGYPGEVGRQLKYRKQALATLIAFKFTFVALSIALSVSACNSVSQAVSSVKTGTYAPGFILNSVRGGAYNLASLRGQSVLVSFMNTQAKATSAEADPSRAQIPVLKSMQQQYAPQGLTVMIVDAARLTTGNQPSLSDLINFTYDWRLDSIPVLVDEKGQVADLFGVSSVPTTFLIGSDGLIQQRWDGIAASAQIALAIEGGARVLASHATQPSLTSALNTCPQESFPQATFAGVGLARSLSNAIWLVDNGRTWEVSEKFALQWIVIDDANKAGSGKVRLQVTGRYLNSDSFNLIDKEVAVLTEDEAHGLLNQSNQQDSHGPKIYLLPISVALDAPGCLELQAIVTDEGTGNALYTGQTFVSVTS